MVRTALSLLVLSLSATAYAATPCAPVSMTSADSITLDPAHLEDGIPLDGLTLQSIDPDEIDVASACIPTILVGGVPVGSIDPDEIDYEGSQTLVAFTPSVIGSELVLTGWLGTTTMVTTTGQPVFAATDVTFREEVVSNRPYVTRTVMDLTLELVDVQVADEGVEPVTLYVDGALTLSIMPEMPLCSRCNM